MVKLQNGEITELHTYKPNCVTVRKQHLFMAQWIQQG